MTRCTEKFQDQMELSQLAVTQLIKTITLDNCLDLLQVADHHIVDELKINCLKFILINLVSFFSEGSKFND